MYFEKRLLIYSFQVTNVTVTLTNVSVHTYTEYTLSHTVVSK